MLDIYPNAGSRPQSFAPDEISHLSAVHWLSVAFEMVHPLLLSNPKVRGHRRTSSPSLVNFTMVSFLSDFSKHV